MKGLLLAAGLMVAPASSAARAPALPAPRQPLSLVLPLAADHRGLEQFARAVSTPGSPGYGRYEPIAWLSARFGASPRVRAGVTRYLRRIGATGVRIDATGLFADAAMPAALAQRVFRAPLRRFRTAGAAAFTAPVSPVRIPAGLRGAVTGVVGLDTRPLGRPALAAARADRWSGARADRSARASSATTSALPHTGTSSGCPAGVTAGEAGGNPATDGFTPNQYLTAYGYAPLQAAGFSGQGERVALIEIDGFNRGDIETFAECFGLRLPPIRPFGVGVPHPLGPGGEATLDVEVLAAAAPGLDGIDVYEAKANAAETLRAMTAPLQNKGFHPQVISASLGLCEPAVAGAVGIAGLRASEAALAMAAASGVTFLASSGDDGSADCTGSDGTPLPRLAVNYPASSPWATGVGGTNLQLSDANAIVGQFVWNDGSVAPGAASGGGSSELFRRPYFQNGTVPQNRRAVPDLAMLADVVPGYAFYCTANRDCVSPQNPDPWQSVGGTSAATPLLAGGLAIIDQQLRTQQRQDLGLVNPLLYSIGRSRSLRGQVFSDVVQFDNDVGPYIAGTGETLGCCTARAGFDRASGWGSVNLAALSLAAIARTPFKISLALPRHQRPVHGRVILATVSCAGPCRIGAYAQVTIGRVRPFQASSGVAKLHRPGSRTLHIRFSRRELARLRSALRRHRHVRATVFAVTVQGGRTIQSQTAGKQLQITG